MASPWIEACIESAYGWTDEHGLPRRLADEYQVEWAADLYQEDPLTDDRRMFWLSVPNLDPPNAALDEWGSFIAIAKELSKYEGTGDARELLMSVEFERRMESERDAQSRRRKGKEAPWKPEVRAIVIAKGTRDFDQILAAIEAAVDQGCFTAVNHEWETIRYLAAGRDRDIEFSTLRDFLSRPSSNNLPI